MRCAATRLSSSAGDFERLSPVTMSWAGISSRPSAFSTRRYIAWLRYSSSAPSRAAARPAARSFRQDSSGLSRVVSMTSTPGTHCFSAASM